MRSSKVILDVRGLLMHSYYSGVDPDAIKDGDLRINSAAFGFQVWLERYLNDILETTPPRNLVAVYDSGHEYRTAIYADYKRKRHEEREKNDPRLRRALKDLEDASKAFLANIGATCISVEGVEADDVIALICQGFRDQGKMIYTNDADLLQLSDENTLVMLSGQPVTGEYKGIPLDLIALNKALVGDSSDGYLGLRRFGPKAWQHLQDEFGVDGLREIRDCFVSGNFDLINECADESGDKVMKHLADNLREARTGFQLASLAPEICYEFRGRKLIKPRIYTRVPNRQRVAGILDSMHCPAYISKYEHLFPVVKLVTAENVEEAAEHFLACLDETPFFSFDYETVDTLKHPAFNEAMSAASKSGGNYVDVLSSRPTGCAITYGEHLQHTIYLSCGHRDTANVEMSWIKDFLESAIETGKPLVAQNAAFETQVSKLQLALEIPAPYDTQIMASYVDEDGDAHLKALSKDWLAYTQATYKETLQAANAQDMAELTGEQVLSYGADDAIVTAHLARLLSFIMMLEGTWEFYEQNERKPVHLLNEAFETGARINFTKLQELAERDREVIDTGTARIRELLSLHCLSANAEAAAALDKAAGQDLYLLEKAAGKYGESKLFARREERKLAWQEAAIYRPVVVQTTLPEFVGTPSQLNLVMKDLGLTEHTLKATSRPQINELLTRIAPARADSQVDTFCRLLGEATHLLKKREGPEFDALKAFCQPFLGSGKEVREGDELNFDSPPQMQALLYLKLALPVRVRGKVLRGSSRDELGLEGPPATGSRAMQMAIAEDCEGLAWKKETLETLLKVKKGMKRFSMYYNPYPLWKHPRDGMIHPGIRNCGTVTRRPTGTNPNILQVEKGETRQIYLPRFEDHVIVALDFNGQELRIAGSEARDPVLIDCYTGGGTYTDEDGMVHPVVKDVHSVTAVSFAPKIFSQHGISYAEISYDDFRAMIKGASTPEEAKVAGLCRKYAKMVNFLIIYVGQASTLAMNLGMPKAFCEGLMSGVFRAYPRLAPWQEETIQFGRTHGYVKTAYGNRRHLTAELRSNDSGLRSRQERQAVNFTVQGCAADILKVVMTNAVDTRLFGETKARLIAPVYDEIVASVPASKAFEYCSRLQGLMNLTPPGHAIPMLAEVSIGPNWGECEELGNNPSEKLVASTLEKIVNRRVAV